MAAPQPKIASLEALRGLLALWVVVCHVTARIVSDATIRNAHFQAVLEPLIPVTVFMILSGFVIFALLQREHPSYGEFVMRRFFRLAPLYFVVLPWRWRWAISSFAPWTTCFGATPTSMTASRSITRL